jgi:hypothetical protein
MRWLIGCALVGLVYGTAVADGLIFALPEDGTSVRYSLEMKMGRDGMEKSAGGYLTVSSVGKDTVDGQPCRWIEFKMLMDVDGKERAIIAKMLIPEKVLKRGENPAAYMVRGWLKQRDKAEELKDLLGSNAGPLPAFVGGPANDGKKLVKEELDTKIGKLE